MQQTKQNLNNNCFKDNLQELFLNSTNQFKKQLIL